MNNRTRIVTASTPSATPSRECDGRFAALVEQLTNEVLVGGAVDYEAILAQYPEHAAQFEHLLPAMRALADLGQSASRSGGAGHAPAVFGGLERGVLGDFRIVREIGRGGMGIVYEAEQISLSRRVALKVLPFAALLDERQLTRFRNEAQAAAVLRHPHIVGVHCVGCERGVHYYAMELIEGPTLAEVIAEGSGDRGQGASEENVACRNDAPPPFSTHHSSFSIPPDTVLAALDATARSTDDRRYFVQAARIGAEAAEALEYAHQLGVVHRDIKPSNLLLDAAGRVWITDFGLAQVQTGQNLTMTGDLLGTLRYMSPEQAAGGRTVLDQRTDVYSLGVTLYELIALRPAFPDDDRQALLRRILNDEPRPPRRVNASIPRDLETIVLKAIAKSPADRYQTAGDLADDLRRFLESRPIRARRTSRVQRLRYWARRNPVVAGLTAVVFCLLLTLAVGGPVMAWRYAALAKSEQSVTAALGAQLEASRWQLYDQSIPGAYEAWRAGNVARVEELLAAQIPRADQTDLREFCWRHLHHLLQENERTTIFSGNSAIRSMAITPDGARLAFGTTDGLITLLDPATGVTQQLRGHTDTVNDLAISGDGRTLYSASQDGTAGRWDLTSLAPIGAPFEHSGPVKCLGVSPDGALLVTGQNGGQVNAWNVADSRLLKQIAAHETEVWCAKFAPDGRTFATGSLDHTVRIWSAETLEPIKHFEADRASVDALLFAADGRQLIIAGGEGVKVWDLDEDRELPGARLLATSANTLAQVDENLLAVANARNSVSLVDLRSGYTLVEWPGHRNKVNALTLAPDARTLYSASEDGTVKTWELSAVIDETNTAAADDFHWVGGMAYSPRGDRVVTATRHEFKEDTEEIVQIIDARTGEEKVAFTAPLGRLDCVAWSPDGRWVATGGQDEVVIWDASTGKRRLVVSDRPDQYFTVVAWSADGRWLAAGGGTVRNWDGPAQFVIWNINDHWTQSREVLRHVEPSSKLIYSLAFSPSSTDLAVGQPMDDFEVRLWSFNGERWQPRTRPVAIHPGWFQVVAFAGSDLVVSSGADRILSLYRIREGRIVRSITSTDNLYSLAVSPDGRTIAGGSAFVIHFWDTSTGSPLATVPIMPWVVSLRFSPDGKTLAWKGADKAVHFLRTE